MVCNCSHHVGSMSVSSLFISYFTLITVVNIYHSQSISSNRNMKLLRLTCMCSHSAEAAEFRYGFKLLTLRFRFQTLTVTFTVSYFFIMVLWERNSLNVRISIRFQTLLAMCERGLKRKDRCVSLY